MLAPFHCGRLPRQPGLQVSQRVQHRPPLAAADANTWDMPVLRQLPQEARGDAKGLRRFAGPKGKGRGNACWGHVCRSNGSRATKRGSHNRWRSVRQKNAEQWGRRGEKPGKRWVREEKKVLQVFGIRCRMIEHRMLNSR
jgi:hypothetical protein